MGYLVQNNFKNFFKDVRIRDLVYVDRLEDIEVNIKPDWIKEVGPYLYFEEPEMAEAYAAALNAEVGEGFAKARHHGESFHKELNTWVDVWAVDCRLPLVKYWKLESGKPLPRPETRYMSPNHFLVNDKELRAIIQPIIDEFEKYDYRERTPGAPSSEETDEYSNPRL